MTLVAAKSVALQRTSEGVLSTAVEVAQRTIGCDSSFAAVPRSGGAFQIAITNGLRDPRFRDIRVRPRRGLGGRVLQVKRAMLTHDYLADTRISRDYAALVASEGLGSVACVPVAGPDGIAALLYCGLHGSRDLGDVAVSGLADIAHYAEIGLDAVAARERAIKFERLRERQRLATEMHDSVAQMLFGISAAAHCARDQRDSAALLATMRQIEAMAADARRELRAALQRLSASPEGVAFTARLEGELRLVEKTTGCVVRLVERGEVRAMPEAIEDLLVDVSIEGLRNAVKHADARLAAVHLELEPERVVLAVQTESTGGDASHKHLAASGTGTGLALLRARADGLRGRLDLATPTNGSTSLRLALPLQPSPLT